MKTDKEPEQGRALPEALINQQAGLMGGGRLGGGCVGGVGWGVEGERFKMIHPASQHCCLLCDGGRRHGGRQVRSVELGDEPCEWHRGRVTALFCSHPALLPSTNWAELSPW